ncbi:MAG: class I SAM-dependent methyltransferase [Caldimonas sp.]
MHAHADATASNWVRRWSHLIPAAATVLDVACGSGRHVRWFAQRGCRVTGVDRDAAAMEPLADLAELHVADIEGGRWPFSARRFDAVIVTNYLWRDRLPDVLECLADGGFLIYETFSAGNETVGKPSNPAFLLHRGELLQATRNLRVVAFEEGFESTPPRFVQRIVAVRERPDADPAPRYALDASSVDRGAVNSQDSEDLP